MAYSKISLSLLALAGSAIGADLPFVGAKGAKFFYENGTQFFIKGVAYQQDTSAAGATFTKKTSFIDPLADEDNCKRDVPLLAELGTNTIRTYAIDPDADHSGCMSLLQDAGIYVISDLGEPSLSINRDDPQWNVDLFSRYQKVVDEMGQYSNVIGFFAGNEVSNNKTNTGASAYVKAAVRDTKKYIKDNFKNPMGVGYAANDDVDIREQISDYFNCGDSEDSIDFWGYNIYSWCGDSDFQKSGYAEQVSFFKNYSVPVFFAEYGCNLPDGAAARTFQETEALYSDQMSSVINGGIVYMYFEEANDYGLVKVNGDSVSKLKDFDPLKKQVLAADPSGVSEDDYEPTNSPQACPDLTPTWEAAADLPPTPDSSLCNCMAKSRECVAKKGLDTDKYGSIFGFICGKFPDVCKGINGNTTTGVYGSYSMCSDSDKLDYVLDAYYNQLDKASDACDFNGDAVVQDASDDGSCNSALASASAANDQAATATSPVDSPDATNSGSSDDDDSFGVPGAPMARLFSLGDYAIGMYMVVAVAVGAGMVAL